MKRRNRKKIKDRKRMRKGGRKRGVEKFLDGIYYLATIYRIRCLRLINLPSTVNFIMVHRLAKGRHYIFISHINRV